MKTIDIVIISYAKNEELERVTRDGINSLIKNSSNSCIIYVVESNPDINYDDYNEYTSKHKVITIHPEEEFGYHKYLNIGRRAGNSKYVALCNSDLTFEKGWDSEIIKVMEKYPEVLSASPWCPQTQKDNTPHGNRVYMGHRVRSEVAGWCIFQQRKIYDIIGELNEGVKFWFSDNIYADELRLRGIKHALVPKSIVNHHDGNLGKTGNSAIDEKTKQEYCMGEQPNYIKALEELKQKISK